MKCPSCQAENDDAAEVCFHCRAVLSAVTQGTLIASRYRILAPLGRGGMGAVYRARDEVLDEEVALKILRPEVAGTKEMAARFRSEIKLARKVSHWNVCRIHEYGEDGAQQYISMELIPGGNLKDRLRGGPLPADQAYDVAVQVADGLAAIHKVGIVHRDLKSANVMIGADGTAKVMDFGIAKAASVGTDGASTGYVLGSPEYMSPEQARGRRADYRSDIYSLGVVVFETFTGRVPFRGATPVATLMMHVEAPPPIDDPLLALPPALVAILRRALAKDPADRFPDAAALGTALRAARTGAGAPDGASGNDVVRTAPRPVVSRSARVSPLMAGSAIAGLALLAAAVVMLRPRQTAVPLPAATPSSASTAAPSPTAAAASPGSYTLTVATATPRVAESPPPTMMRASPAPVVMATPAVPPSPPRPSPESAPSILPTPEAAIIPPSTAPSPTPTAHVEGWLLVLVTPWADVTVDGRAVGTTPLPKFTLPPGSHAVMLTHPGYQPYTRRVEVRPGETTTLRLDFSTDGVRRR